MNFGFSSFTNSSQLGKVCPNGPTDLAVAVPCGTYGRIAPRSDLEPKHHLAVVAGVIDADYSGTVRIVLFNHGNLDFHVSKCDRIAQLLLERIESPPVVFVNHLPETNLGSKGFGSTGMTVLEADGRVVVTPSVPSGGTDPKDWPRPVTPVAVIEAD